MHRIRPVITVVATVFVAMMAFFGTSNASHATSGNKYWGGTYINAWGGGPNIDAYHGSSINDEFAFVPGSGGGNQLMIFIGGGTYNARCIADEGNQSGNARAALYPCSSSSIPWGANIQVRTCSTNSSRLAFYDSRWQGYLAPSSTADGSAFYLNHNGEWCYTPS